MKKFNLSVLSLLAFLFASVNVMAANFADYSNLSAATITVYTAANPTTPVANWGNTITDAVNAAGNGGHVVLSAGKWVINYRDQASFSKSVTLEGAGRDQTFILGNPTEYNNSKDGCKSGSGPSANKYKNVIAIGGPGLDITIKDLTIDACECGSSKAGWFGIMNYSDFVVIRINGGQKDLTPKTVVSMYNCEVLGKNTKTLIQVGSNKGKSTETAALFKAYNCNFGLNGGNAIYAGIDVATSGSSVWSTGTYFAGMVEGNADLNSDESCYYEYKVTGKYNSATKDQPETFHSNIQSVLDWYDTNNSIKAMLPALKYQDGQNATTVLEKMVADLCNCNEVICPSTSNLTPAEKYQMLKHFRAVLDNCQSELGTIYGVEELAAMLNSIDAVIDAGEATQSTACVSPVIKRGDPRTLNYYGAFSDVKIESGATAIVNKVNFKMNGTLTLNGEQGESSQVILENGASLEAENAVFVVTLADDKLDNGQYYAVAVPFDAEVNAIKLANAEMTVAGENEGNFRIYRYDSEKRATDGVNGWVRITKNETLVPGVGYLMSFSSNLYNKVVFTKKAGADINNAADLNVAAYASDNAKDANWNSLANNALCYQNLNGLDGKISVLKNNAYVTMDASEATLTVGAPFFYQAGADATINLVNANTINTLFAPARNFNDNEICLQIKKTADDFIDQMFVSASDDAINEYEIGKDLAKMTINTGKVASIYTEAYGTKLAAFDARFVDDMAVVPFVISAPKAENYTLHMPTATELSVLLTLNGEVVANLSEADYTVAANAGNNNGYALVIARAKGNAPTAIINNTKAAKAVKMMNNGHLFIYTGERAYDAQGRIVK